MSFRKLKMVPPVIIFTLLAILILLLPSLMLPFWAIKFKGIERKMELNSHNISHQIITEIGGRAEILSTMNYSSTTLARFLDSSLQGLNISFAVIEDRVSPVLFQAISTIPLVSQISFTGVENSLFSYQYKDDQLLAVYTNSSQAGNISFSQQVNPDNGKLYGEPTIISGRGNVTDFRFIQTADVADKGSISLVFSEKAVARFFSGLKLYDGYFCLATREGKVIVEGAQNTCLVLESLNQTGTLEGYGGNLTCDYNGSTLTGFVIKIWGRDYRVSCSNFDIFGVQSVYILALPDKQEVNLNKAKTAFILAILTLIATVISAFIFVFIILRATRREMYLCSALIKQMEATQKEETKYARKSLAFANASHDVRAALAGITGLTVMSQQGLDPASDLGSNLKQIEDCTTDLLGILNSVLDVSKIEAGKMQLDEVDFDLAQLLEDVVDFYYPVGLRKGVDVILDPCDGSIFSKYAKVKGDRTKLKQILSNLFSNAVKFTSEGHVVVRCWAKKPSLITPIFSSVPKTSSFSLSSCLFLRKNEEVYDEQNESRFMVQENSGILEFVFEVEDTGTGIPKEKQNYIFENYAQVKETTQDAQEGTGLGLGIVQSLVRLMGGEIKIINKEIGARGTCFRFNIFLARSENINQSETTNEIVLEATNENDLGPCPSALSPKQERSRVVLFIQGEARRRISRKFMEMVGVKVSVVKEWNQISHTLKKVKQKLSITRHSTSSVSDWSLSSENKSIPLSSMDGENEISSYLFGRANAKYISKFVLIIIDTSGGPFRDLSRAVADFRRDLKNTCCRIVWIDKPGAGNMVNSKGLDEGKLPSTDSIISKPFHGSRLYHVIRLLPEFGGTPPSSKKGKSSEIEGEKLLLSSKSKGILTGKNILVVEDNKILRKIAIKIVSQLGATVESCENGEEAVKLVTDGLRSNGQKSSSPYDYILMDCQMPVMDGNEATRIIREEEESYGVRIPIIALTAHTEDEANQMMKNGIDFVLLKPLNEYNLVQAIEYIENSRN